MAPAPGDAPPPPAALYIGHGLRIASDIALPEFSPAPPGPADIVIRAAALPAAAAAEAARAHDEGPARTLRLGAGAHLVAVRGVADFLAEDGRRLTVAAAPGADDALLRVWLHGSATGMLLHQRGLLVLHGAGVLTPRGVAVLLGDSGAGKSTLAAHLGRAGFPVLGDDTLALGADGRVWPGSRRLKLWRDAAEGLGIALGAATPLAHRVEKYWVDCPEAAAPASLPLAELLVLERGAAPALEPAGLLEATALVAAHTYRPEFVALTGRTEAHFRQCAALAARVGAQRLFRPWDAARIGETVAFLAARWGGP